MKNCCQFVFYKNIARFLLLFLLEFLEKKEKNKLRHHHVISHQPKLSINQRMRNRSVTVKKDSRVFHYTYTVLQFFFILMRKARAVRTDSYSVRTLYKRYWTATFEKDRGKVRGEGGELPIIPDSCLRLKFLHRSDCISLFNWLIFWMKRALHFATTVNSGDIKKCNCFWVPFYYLFGSACKAVFPAPTGTGIHRLDKNTWPSLWEVICHKKVQHSFLNQSVGSQSKIPGSSPSHYYLFYF